MNVFSTISVLKPCVFSHFYGWGGKGWGVRGEGEGYFSKISLLKPFLIFFEHFLFWTIQVDMGDPGGDVYGFQSEGLVLWWHCDCFAIVFWLFVFVFVFVFIFVFRVLSCLVFWLWLSCLVIVLFFVLWLSCLALSSLAWSCSPEYGGSCVSSSKGWALRAHGRGLVFVFILSVFVSVSLLSYLCFFFF